VVAAIVGVVSAIGGIVAAIVAAVVVIFGVVAAIVGAIVVVVGVVAAVGFSSDFFDALIISAIIKEIIIITQTPITPYTICFLDNIYINT
jgi:hypothetical protein